MNEYDHYLQSPAPAVFDTLGWWKEHQAVYPRLSRMARDNFAVPATGAGIEREFSKSGRGAIWMHCGRQNGGRMVAKREDYDHILESNVCTFTYWRASK